MAETGVKLEQTFKKAKGGNCPLPEPGQPGTTIEHPHMVRVKKQPKGHEYDRNVAANEQQRYLDLLQKSLKNGDITPEEFAQLAKINGS